MKAISVRFDEEEMKKLDEVVRWYRKHIGLKVSKTMVIKSILFGRYNEAVQTDHIEEKFE